MNQNATASAPEAAGPVERTSNARTYRPNVDILEREEELVVLADMPGVAAESIEVQFEDHQLSITGRAAPRGPENARYLVRQYGVGDFHRTFRVSDDIDAGKITAQYRDGVLRLRLPKAEAARPRKIAVEAS
jgi:HSP20 family molecular chaperone IbpA